MIAVPVDGWLYSARAAAAVRALPGVIEDLVHDDDVEIRAMTLSLVRRGGKRLRPALLCLAGELGDAEPERLRRAAAALELLHVASLYHDDVMDRAPVRRGAPSVNAVWGNRAASIAGTYLVARSGVLFAELGEDCSGLVARAMVDLCVGQLQELEHGYDLGLTATDHLNILARKTATLFQLPCALGCALGHVPQVIATALDVYARHLGLAFQLADDALDIAGASEVTGKAAGTDLRAGVYSHAVRQVLTRPGPAGDRARAVLERTRLTDEEVRSVLDAVITSGAVAEAVQLARARARLAEDALDALPDGDVRRSLHALARLVADRNA